MLGYLLRIEKKLCLRHPSLGESNIHFRVVYGAKVISEFEIGMVESKNRCRPKCTRCDKATRVDICGHDDPIAFPTVDQETSLSHLQDHLDNSN